MVPELRDYVAGDRDAVARLWHDAWQATGLAAPNDPTVDGYRERLHSDGRDWLIRVACADGTIVGFAAFDLVEARLRQLFVSPAHQRTGVGTRLLDDARRAMPSGFRLRTDRDNRSARRFYEARGLLPEGEAIHPEHGHPIARYRCPATDEVRPARARGHG